MLEIRRKIKVYTFLTSVERAEAQMVAQARQLTLSEWIRQAVLDSLKNKVAEVQTKTPIDAKSLLSDFQFGDIHEHEKDNE